MSISESTTSPFSAFWAEMERWEEWVSSGAARALALLPLAAGRRGQCVNHNIWRRSADGRVFELWTGPDGGYNYATGAWRYREVAQDPAVGLYKAVPGGEVLERQGNGDPTFVRSSYTPEGYAQAWVWERDRYGSDSYTHLSGSLEHFQRGLEFVRAIRGAKGLVEAKLKELAVTDDAREALRGVAAAVGVSTRDIPDCGSISAAASVAVHRLSGMYEGRPLPMYAY
jgi:hypothetical protein